MANSYSNSTVMALTLESIYKPMNGFFLNLYKTGVESPVFFKFDKFGSLISDDDFTGANPTEETGIALERYSDLVNRLPIEDDDGLNILFSTNLIDDIYYYRLLNASIPFASDTDPNKEDIINAVSKTIADAKKEFEQLSLAREGIPTYFRASYAAPNNWYDRTNKEIWTNHLFQAAEPASTPVNNNPKFQLWKLKVDDAILQNVLPVKNITDPVKPAELYDRVLLMKKNPALSIPAIAATRSVHESMSPAAHLTTAADRTSAINVRDHRSGQAITEVRDHRNGSSAATGNFTIHNTLQKTILKLGWKQRYVVNQYIKENAPTQPATTNDITISFDYCKVDIRRPWLFNTFLSNDSWFVPGMSKGQLSSLNTTDNISVLPIAFVAIKNLSIEANWSDTDIAHSQEATDFGPFEVNGGIINNKLSHEGIQIIGWVLQKLPDLPPHDPPQ